MFYQFFMVNCGLFNVLWWRLFKSNGKCDSIVVLEKKIDYYLCWFVEQCCEIEIWVHQHLNVIINAGKLYSEVDRLLFISFALFYLSSLHEIQSFHYIRRCLFDEKGKPNLDIQVI